MALDAAPMINSRATSDLERRARLRKTLPREVTAANLGAATRNGKVLA
jgi:hypothetical protein